MPHERAGVSPSNEEVCSFVRHNKSLPLSRDFLVIKTSILSIFDFKSFKSLLFVDLYCLAGVSNWIVLWYVNKRWRKVTFPFSDYQNIWNGTEIEHDSLIIIVISMATWNLSRIYMLLKLENENLHKID